jgi:tRNA dimethylallyltransferase
MLAVLGPTATGKTGLAIELAARLDGEIVSLDSRQAYRGLAVGTAAPGAAELVRVRHHGVGFLPPGARYGAGQFSRLARTWIDEIRVRDHLPILVGGTGLFYRALVRPIFREPPIDRTRRAALEDWLEERPLEALRRWASVLDPALGGRLDVLDRQRCLRAIEMALLTGRPLTWWQRNGALEAESVRALPVVLTLPGDEHRRRIRERAARALNGGWADEIRGLRIAGHDRESPAFSSIGYAAVDDWLSGEISREQALTLIVRDTWAYARRQRTWFRHQVPQEAPRLDASEPVDVLARRVCTAWGTWRPDDNGDREGTSA